MCTSSVELLLMTASLVTLNQICRAVPSLHDHPFTDMLSLVGDPLSGNGCGSPNQI